MINEEIVKKIASLSKLRIDDENMAEVQNEFTSILNWVQQLEDVNTDNIKPMIAVNNQNIICREDEVTVNNNAEAVLKNAPATEYGYFVVPKVVE